MTDLIVGIVILIISIIFGMVGDIAISDALINDRLK